MYLKYLYLHIYLHCKFRSSAVTDKQQGVSFNVMSAHLSVFVDFVNRFIRYRSRHRTSELSLIGIAMVSTTFFFLERNYFCGTKILNFTNVFSKPTLCILIKFDTGFFSRRSLTRLVNMT